MRVKLPNRRRTLTEPIEFNNTKYFVSFGVDEEDVIKEVWCANPMIGSDIYALMVTGCILISLHLQTGAEIERLNKSMPENRNEGEIVGKPTDVLVAIVRKALEVQNWLNNKGENLQ